MNEAQIVRKIQLLKQIKPNKEWAILTRNRLLGESVRPIGPIGQIGTIFEIFPRFVKVPRPGLGIQFRLALASFVVLAAVVSGAGLVKSALPGDFLYSLKRMGEKAETSFVSQKNLPKAQLELADRRLEELSAVAQSNKARNLAPAINEFKLSLNQAAGNLRKVNDSPRFVKEIADQVQKLEEKKQEVEALGVVIGESEELNQALAQMVEREIKDLENRSLTEEQAGIFVQAKQDFEAGNFSQALGKLLKLSYPQE